MLALFSGFRQLYLLQDLQMYMDVGFGWHSILLVAISSLPLVFTYRLTMLFSALGTQALSIIRGADPRCIPT